jgi:hypothetical protein
MARLAAHGTDSGYQKHLRLRQRPCLRCHDAHNDANTRRAQARALADPPPAVVPTAGYWHADDPSGYLDARLGHEPAEALGRDDRWRLVAELHGLGWSDEQIAEHTRQTLYTTCRIRSRIGLSANQPAERSAA